MDQNFSFGDLDQVEEMNFDPIPPGVYELRSVEQEMHDTKSNTGSYLKVQFEVVSGALAGRKIFQNFNLVNQNAQAVEIALREVKGWLAACGLPAGGQLTMAVVNSLEGRTFHGKVGIEKDSSGQHEDKNVIKRFIAAANAGAQAPAAGAQPGTQAPAAPAAAPTDNKKPWEA